MHKQIVTKVIYEKSLKTRAARTQKLSIS